MLTQQVYNYFINDIKTTLYLYYRQMSNRNRIGNRWTINEVLSLQREFELLEWDIDQIANKHGRTPEGIMNKLDSEGFADYNVLYSNYYDLNAKMPVSRTAKCDTLVLDVVDSEDEEEVDDITDEDYVDNADEEDNDDDYDDDDDDPLTRRVSKLETGLEEIKNMLKQMVINSQPSCGINNCNSKSCNL